jgi:hypothetical protein
MHLSSRSYLLKAYVISIWLLPLMVTQIFEVGKAKATTPSMQTIAQARQGFQLYRHQNLYTIEIPTGWFVDASAGGYNSQSLTFLNRQPPGIGSNVFPPDLVRTSIDIFDEPFDAVVRNFTQPQYSTDELVTRRGTISIGNMRALRLWTTNESSESIITIIEYSRNQTAVIASHHGNRSWVETIQDIHWSFRKIN